MDKTPEIHDAWIAVVNNFISRVRNLANSPSDPAGTSIALADAIQQFDIGLWDAQENLLKESNVTIVEQTQNTNKGIQEEDRWQ